MLKMSELVKQSGVSKSTILYYIKEGLLPQPKKLKANLHMYDENMVERIGFIQYLQKNFHSSIAELKAIFSYDEFDDKDPYKALLGLLPVLMGADFTQTYTLHELSTLLHVSEKKLQTFIDSGYIYEREGVFTETEKEMFRIVLSSDVSELSLIKKYVNLSRQMAKLEVEMGLKRLNQKDKNFKHFFDILLILKPYIFNLQTLSTYQKGKSDEKITSN